MLRNTANSPPKSTPGGFHENFQDFCRFTRDPGSSLQNPLYFACQTSTRLHSRISSKFTVFRKWPNSPIPSNVFEHDFHRKSQDSTETLQNPRFGFPYAAPEFGPEFSEITKLSFSSEIPWDFPKFHQNPTKSRRTLQNLDYVPRNNARSENDDFIKISQFSQNCTQTPWKSPKPPL